MRRPTPGFSRRLRRAYATAAVLALTAAILGAGYYAVRQRLQPAEYQPGEDNADITSSLARGLPADAPAPRFTDVTREAGLAGAGAFAGARTSQLPEDMGPGAAWGDFDNDGDDDLFVVSAGGALGLPEEARTPSRLFENAGGRFRPVDRFPAPKILGMGAAWGDVDGDGWLDLVITGYHALYLYRNEEGRFTRDERFPNPPGFWAGAAWGDYDADGDLDLYVCGYVQYVETDADRARASDHYGTSVPYSLNPASYEPQPNLLLRNDGSGRFTDVAGRLGVDNPAGRSLSALWHDVDEDGWLDLYVANDISDNVLYRNEGGRFTDISHPAWVADYRGAMGLAAGDWNRDGDDDLFVTHWVAQENALYDSMLAEAQEFPVPVPASASASKAPRPPVRFVDSADGVGLGQIALRMIGWGTEFADLDADGWLDLVVSNGSTFETGDRPPRLEAQAPFLFWNRRGEHFHDLAPHDPVLAAPRVGRGLALSDYDGDGDIDVLLARHDAGVQLLRNDMPQGNWLKLALRRPSSSGAPGPAWGARVTLRLGETTIERSLSSASYLSQSSSLLHVGLGRATRVDRVEIRWGPGAPAAALGPLAANRMYEIVAGTAAARPLERPVAVPQDPRERQIEFWKLQRAGMDALKRDGDLERAAGLLRRALVLDASHEDTRYYLGNALAAGGDPEAALEQFDRLRRDSPQSHRAHARWGTLRAETAGAAPQLAAADEALATAHALNPEETGVLLAMGEVGLLQNDLTKAEQRLVDVTRSNSRSAHALFLRGYIRWKRGHAAAAAQLLERCRAALGPDWKPAGTTAEGDVKRQAHSEHTPLARFVEEWSGSGDPAAAYASLDRHLRDYRRRLGTP